jgi:serine/threonine protein kinase
MARVFQAGSGQAVYLDQQVASGGEGEIWKVAGYPQLVAKIYHPQALNQADDKEAKLRAMVSNPPSDEMVARYGHVSIAWPNELLYRNGAFAGFLMPRLAQSFTILDVYNPARRKKLCPGYNWKYLFHTALNLATAIDALHARDYIMGDINEGNILVTSRALVSLIDTDSYQVLDEYGLIHRCPVGKIEFTPPELQGVRFDQVDRHFEHDYFGLGVLIFLLLMQGNHPFAGLLKREVPTDQPASVYCLQRGAFPYVRNPLVGPRPGAPKFEILPKEVRRLLVRCFWEGHKNPLARPSAAEWAQVLEEAEGQLVECRRNPEHYYSRHLPQCSWCWRAGLQKPLRPVKAPPTLPDEPPSAARQVLPASKPPSSHRPAAQAQPAQPAGMPKTASQQTTSRPGTAPHSVPQARPARLGVASPVLPRLLPVRPRLITPRSPGASGRWDWRSQARRWFHSPGGALSWQDWWSETRLALLMGVAGGLALFLGTILMFEYPFPTGKVFGILVAVLVAVLSLLGVISFLRRRQRSDLAIALGLLMVGVYLTYSLGMRANTLATSFLTTHTLHPGWLFLACSLVGLFEGAACGNYQALLGKRSRALAVATSLALALLPWAGICFWGLLSLAFIAS